MCEDVEVLDHDLLSMGLVEFGGGDDFSAWKRAADIDGSGVMVYVFDDGHWEVYAPGRDDDVSPALEGRSLARLRLGLGMYG